MFSISATRFLNIKSREHFAEQELFVRNCKNSGLRHKNCEVCCYPKCKCTCQEPDDSIQGGVYSLVDNFCEHIGTKAANYIIYNWNKVVPNLLEQTICEPSTINYQPSTHNHEVRASALNHQLSTINYQQSTHSA